MTANSDIGAGDVTTEDRQLLIHGTSSDNITSKDGLHFNGTASSGNRYVKFTTGYGFNISVTSNVDRIYCTTIEQTKNGTLLKSGTSVHFDAGTYYLYPSGGAVNLHTLKITPDAE